MSFLTVEDVNTIIRKYGPLNDFHKIDTSLITDSDVDFENVTYDFVRVSRSKLDNDAGFEFKFVVNNNRWIGQYYFTESDGTYIDKDASYAASSKTITFVADDKDVVLVLYCTSLHSWDSFKRIIYLMEDDLSRRLPIDGFDKWYSVAKVKYLPNDTEQRGGIIHVINPGVFDWVYSNKYYYLGSLVKTDFKFDCTYQPKLDKINKVPLGVSENYKPGGSLVQDYAPSLSVLWNDKVLPVEYDEDLEDYCFTLDLTGRTSLKSVKLSLDVEANKVLNHTVTEFTVVPTMETVDSFEELLAACSLGGANVIRLGSDLTATSIIPVNHDILIEGNSQSFNLNDYGFDLLEGVNVTVENLHVYNGDTCFLQAENTELTIKDCTFTNCTSNKYNELGSIIFCEITSSNIEDTTDFTTTITGTTFMNNQSCILHGGDLSIDKCKFLQNDTEYMNTKNVAFLYQTDGTANITESIFDIDYDTDNLCSNHVDIGYAQALIKIGETATINGATITDISKDDSLPFTSNPYRNQSHVFVKYYYPSIESCVYTSPVLGREDINVCYAVSNLNWIFKQNTQVTRAEWETENRIRKINW